MKRFAPAFLGVLLLSVSASVQARPDTFDFNFSFTGLIAGSGTFVAKSTSDLNLYQITGITGSVDGVTIAGLLPPGSFPLPEPGANDNLLVYLPTTTISYTYLDFDGVSFKDTDGNAINLYFDGHTYNVIDGSVSTITFTLGAPTPATVTPEPATLVLMGTGALGSLGTLRRRFRGKH